jgi:NadR type nicotinamide-nucleotide adenylyltransferase
MDLVEAQPRGEPRARTGLIIGKFLPPHLGHLHLIDRARAEVETLTVLVCSLASEPIAGATRHAWVRDLRPDVHVLHHTDENPQEPEQHPRFWEIWTESIRRLVPDGPALVFTSESYGDELARRLGARHVCVDPARALVPVSGRAIRESPLLHWAFLPPPVRAHYAARVAIVGTESTGKTTLAAALARRWRTEWVPEFARAYLEERGPVTQPDGSTEICTLADIEPIARGHIAAEDRLAPWANRVLFSDTDLSVTEIWSREYFGSCPEWVSRASREPRYALTLLTGTDIPYEADWQRDRPHMREEMHARFRAALEERGRRYVEVRGSPEARLARADAAIEEVFGIRRPD